VEGEKEEKEVERKIACVRMKQRRSLTHIHKTLTCLSSGLADWSDSFPSLEDT
jgi:hypothetical protein